MGKDKDKTPAKNQSAAALEAADLAAIENVSEQAYVVAAKDFQKKNTVGDGDCLLHAVFGVESGSAVRMPGTQAQELRTFLFDVVHSFDDGFIESEDTDPDLLQVMRHIGAAFPAEYADIKRERKKGKEKEKSETEAAFTEAVQAEVQEGEYQLIAELAHEFAAMSAQSTDALERLKLAVLNRIDLAPTRPIDRQVVVQYSAVLDNFIHVATHSGDVNAFLSQEKEYPDGNVRTNFEVMGMFLDKDDRAKNTEISTFKVYRNHYCVGDRFLSSSEIELIAILSNLYIFNWVKNDKQYVAGNQANTKVYKPNPEARQKLIEHLVRKKIKTPDVIAKRNQNVSVAHIENSGNFHFSKVNLLNDADKALEGLTEALAASNRRVKSSASFENEEVDSVSSRSKSSSGTSDSAASSGSKDKDNKVQEPQKKSEILAVPDFIKNKKLEVAGFMQVTVMQPIVWTDEEKRKIYRNNINYILYMMRLAQGDKPAAVQRIKSAKINESIVYRDVGQQAGEHYYYVKIDPNTPDDLAGILIQNIAAYEAIKSSTKPQSKILSEYQTLRATLAKTKQEDQLLAQPELQTFIEHAFARTEQKKPFYQQRIQQKVRSDAPKEAQAMIHHKAPGSEKEPSHYHMEGLTSDLAAVAKWVNEDLPKKDHILVKDKLHHYRMYITPHPLNKDVYQMYKFEVDDKGNYLPGAKPEKISRDEEVLWDKDFQKLFEAYKEQYAQAHKLKINLHKAGFNPQ